MKKQRLELTWIGKDQQPRLEPRILIEDPEKSYGDKNSQNMLIKGDNLLALKALEQDYAGKVKCIFIDPPYNTGSAFEHYDDGLEHSLWLGLMRDRLNILKNLLAEDGVFWITLDDNEAHYLKVMADEVFGRNNFVANIVWQKKYSKQNDAKWFSTSHDHIFVYAKNKNMWKPNKIMRNESQLKGYKNPDNDPKGLWQSVVYTCSKTRHERPNLYYPIIHPKTGEEIYPSETRVWGYDKNRHEEHIKEGKIWWGLNDEKDKPRLKSYLKDVGKGLVPDTLWLRSDVGDNQDAKREARAFNQSNTFATPKPEKLISNILEISTQKGDLILDSFLGSGTTAAVAHKMNRRWIGIEMGEHCDTHCLPRLKKVMDGQDPGGVTSTANWEGGGGFKYYSLAPSLLKEDKYGNWVIDPRYNANMLAAAMAKHECFRYAPDEAIFWKQGQSTEKDFIFTTTNFLTVEFLDRIHGEMQEDESLLICCKSFQDACLDRHNNITVKKIPQMLLGRCEFGREDYSLHIITVPSAEDADDEPPKPPKPKPKRKGKAVQQANFLEELIGEDA